MSHSLGEEMRRVRIAPDGKGGMSLVVDGVDVSNFVNRDGVAIEFKEGRAYVWLPVSPVMLVGEFPEAVVNALRGELLDWEKLQNKIEEVIVDPCFSPECMFYDSRGSSCAGCASVAITEWIRREWT